MIKRLPASRSDALPSDVVANFIYVRRLQVLDLRRRHNQPDRNAYRLPHEGLGITFATAAIIGVTAGRLKLTREYHARLQTGELVDVDTLERTYLLGTCAYLLSIGFLIFTTFNTSNDAFVLIAACSTAIFHALSIAVRNFAVQYGVRLQIAVIAIPLAAALSSRAAFSLSLLSCSCCRFACLSSRSHVAFAWHIAQSDRFSDQTEKIAGQFDFAINNMSHGMCMISAGMKIAVSNGRFRNFWD